MKLGSMVQGVQHWVNPLQNMNEPKGLSKVNSQAHQLLLIVTTQLLYFLYRENAYISSMAAWYIIIVYITQDKLPVDACRTGWPLSLSNLLCVHTICWLLWVCYRNTSLLLFTAQTTLTALLYTGKPPKKPNLNLQVFPQQTQMEEWMVETWGSSNSDCVHPSCIYMGTLFCMGILGTSLG